MITVTNLTIQFGKRVLYKDVNLKFTNGNIYGIIGANGAGKSTLLKAISGELEPNKGTVELGPGERMSILDQDHFKFDEYRVIDTVLMGHQPLWENMKEREALYSKPEMTEEDGNRAADSEDKFASMDGWNAESDAAQMLSNVGIKEELHTKLMSELSNNEKVRVMLAKALFGNPDNLLLDEPTNDLDIVTLNVLEEFLLDYEGCLVIVSHDRYFMDKIVDHLFVFKGEGEVQDFPGNYSDYFSYEQSSVRETPKEEKAPATKNSWRGANSTLSQNEQRELSRLEKEIAQLEAQKATIEAHFTQEALSSEELQEQSQALSEVLTLLEEKSDRWLELSIKSEEG